MRISLDRRPYPSWRIIRGRAFGSTLYSIRRQYLAPVIVWGLARLGTRSVHHLDHLIISSFGYHVSMPNFEMVGRKYTGTGQPMYDVKA